MTKILFISTVSVIVLLSGCGESQKETKTNEPKKETTQLNQTKAQTNNQQTNEAKKESAQTVKQEVKKETKQSNKNAEAKRLYSKCASCHGIDGKTKAMGKSAIIARQSSQDLQKKLKEYKEGKRDVSGMGSVMKNQVTSLSDKELKILADYISSLK